MAASRTASLNELALNRTNGYTPTPSAEWCCIEMDNDWFVLFSGRNSAPEEFSPEFLTVLSKRSEMVVAVIEEPIMFSSVSYWVDGRSIWSVVHDAQRGIDHIDVRGELPDAVEAFTRRGRPGRTNMARRSRNSITFSKFRLRWLPG